jgi:two-component system, cell cycle sensor histidine kinase and response regulator CckA
MTRMEGEEGSYRAFVRAQIEAISEALTNVMLGDFTVVARTTRPDEDFGYLCAMINVAINAARNSQAELRATNQALRQARAVAAEREEDMRTTLDSIGDAVIATDVQGAVTRMNPVAQKLTGWSAEGARGRPLVEVFRIVNEDTREPVESPVVRVLRDGVVVGLANHTALISRDGVERAIADSGAPIHDADGVLRGVVLVFRDQTDERKAERGRRGSEARKAAVLESALDCIVTMDHTGRIIEFNPAAEKTFGYSSAEAIGKSLAEMLVPAALRERHNEGLRNYLATGKGRILGKRTELTALRADGSEFPVEVAVVAINEEDPPVFTGYIRDLTAQRKSAEALRLSEERYRRIVETMNEGIWILDTDSRTTFVNARVAQMLGRDANELMGEPLVGFVHQDSLATVEAKLSRDQAVIPQQSEIKLVRKDGTDLWVFLDWTPSFDSSGKHEGALVLLMDVTERKRLEEQVRRSQKMEAVGRLAGGIAHDFNNMLTPIMTYAALILADLKPGDPMREDLTEIRKAAEQAHSITQQLLAFSRQKIVQPEPVSLNRSVTEMERLLRRVIGEHIDLGIRLDRNLDTALLDPGEVEQVIMNLVLNARDAMPSGGKLSIETKNVLLDEGYVMNHVGTEPGPHVMLAVSDTGAGMDAETQAHIFEPFFTTKTGGKGTGLGLATVFAIVTKSRGNVWVYSERGKGTSFKVYFPRHGQKAGASDQPSAAFAADHGSETILLVEDDDLVRGSVKAVLRRKGYVVLVARSGGEAVLMSEEHAGEIHLMLTDVVMPAMGGRELAERLAKSRPRMKVLYMSGYTSDSVLRQAVLEQGMPFVQKPFTPDVLARKVRDVLDDAHGKADA